MKIEKDKVVSMHYQLKLDSGEMINSSFDREEPLVFLAGAKNIIPGLENELMGMTKGDKKSVSVAPEDAYGVQDDELVQTYSREQLPTEIEYEEGRMLNLQSQNGHPVQVLIKAVTDDNITLDMNHPLAGEVLSFDVEIVDVKDGIVTVRLQGDCGGCPMSQMTLKNGIEKILKKEVPEVVSVESAP